MFQKFKLYGPAWRILVALSIFCRQSRAVWDPVPSQCITNHLTSRHRNGFGDVLIPSLAWKCLDLVMVPYVKCISCEGFFKVCTILVSVSFVILFREPLALGSSPKQRFVSRVSRWHDFAFCYQSSIGHSKKWSRRMYTRVGPSFQKSGVSVCLV